MAEEKRYSDEPCYPEEEEWVFCECSWCGGDMVVESMDDFTGTLVLRCVVCEHSDVFYSLGIKGLLELARKLSGKEEEDSDEED